MNSASLCLWINTATTWIPDTWLMESFSEHLQDRASQKHLLVKGLHSAFLVGLGTSKMLSH